MYVRALRSLSVNPLTSRSSAIERPIEDTLFLTDNPGLRGRFISESYNHGRLRARDTHSDGELSMIAGDNAVLRI
jgi:hypothetical protein